MEQSGEPDISSPLVFAEGLFVFINVFIEKDGFLKIMWYNKYTKFSKVDFINNKK
jgi:hypothetical protein